MQEDDGAIRVDREALGGAQVALVAMRPNGEVVAMIGGTDYGTSPFNRATQARRQPGSTFKLFVYLTALEEGWEPEDLISNRPIEQGSYRPRNASGNYSETISLATCSQVRPFPWTVGAAGCPKPVLAFITKASTSLFAPGAIGPVL